MIQLSIAPNWKLMVGAQPIDLLILVQTASPARTNGPSSCHTLAVCWAGWAWSGWPAVAAIGQIAAALGTLAALIFLWLQVRAILKGQVLETANRVQDEARRDKERREDFERAHTPYVSVEVVTPAHGFQELPLANVLAADCRVNADGQGVAYDIEVTLRIEHDGTLQHAHTSPIRYLRAPGSVATDLRWIFGTVGQQDRRAEVEVAFTSMFSARQRLRHDGWINDAGGLRLDGPPHP